MSDYFMTHEVKQRISDLQHLREQTRQAGELAERPKRIRLWSVQPVRLVKAVQVILNAIVHAKSLSRAVLPSPHRTVYAIPERTPLAVDRSRHP